MKKKPFTPDLESFLKLRKTTIKDFVGNAYTGSAEEKLFKVKKDFKVSDKLALEIIDTFSSKPKKIKSEASVVNELPPQELNPIVEEASPELFSGSKRGRKKKEEETTEENISNVEPSTEE